MHQHSSYTHLFLRSSSYLLFIIGIFISSVVVAGDHSSVSRLKNLDISSLILLDKTGDILESHHPDNAMIPASTMKILTALFALETWGSEYRFITDFTLDSSQNLWVKGYGDPFLISEEIDKIVLGLKLKGLTKINGIGLDLSYFSDDITIHGQSKTDNPYDASPGSLVANFNTINIVRKNNLTYSAEKQTPLTKTMLEIGSKYNTGTHRVSIQRKLVGAHNFAEVLLLKLNQQHVQTTNSIIIGSYPISIATFYRHHNSHKLSEIISAMLKYSNNFIANQLFLLLGIESSGAPASINKSQAAIQDFIEELFQWETFSIKEGAGLSRENRLSSQQLIDVLQRFSPYRTLLSQQSKNIYVKSGTLKNVSTYAGYLFKSNSWLPFALMINQPVSHNFRKQVAQELVDHH